MRVKLAIMTGWMTRTALCFALLAGVTSGARSDSVDRVGLPCDEVTLLAKQETSSLSDNHLVTLAAAYEYGECVEQNGKRAYESYRAAVERGVRIVKAKLGALYLKGVGVERDLNKARYWFRSYALASYRAEDNVMVALLQAALFDTALPDMLLEEIDRAIEDGKGPAEIWMQHYRDLLNGNGVYPDRSGAMSWLHLAVMSKYPAAYYEKAHRALGDESNFNVYKSISYLLRKPITHRPRLITGNFF